MNRQLRADGGIMQVAPREKFGLGSSIKKFVRKIIPNEVSEIAVKAAPFVAPFNPLLAAGMAGIGGFDQTGRIGSSLKNAALTYGLGQGARYLGGADFQGLQNPFAKDAFGMPTGSGGIKNLFKNNTTQAIQPVSGGEFGQFTEPTFGAGDALGGEGLTGAGEIISSSTTTPPGSAIESLKSVVSFETSAADKGKAALDLLKRGSKTLFTKSDGSIDKAAVIGAATAAVSYAEALALAKNAGVELTEEEYNQAQADEKREEYAGYLQNFFGGKKDGGRIGFKDGPSESDIFGIGGETLMKDKGKTIKKGFKSIGDLILDDEGNMYTPLQYLRKFGEDIFFGGQKNPELPEEFYNKLSDEYVQEMKQVKERGYANGGRIGFESGANEMIKTQLLEDIMPETTTEDFVIIMTEDGPVKVKKSDLPPESMMMDTSTGFGTNITRVDRKFGSPKEGEAEIGIMSIDVEAGDDEDEEDMMMAGGGITFTSAEKSYLFRRLGGSGGPDRSFTMPQLYGILKNPNSPANIDDAKVLKQIAIMGLEGRKDGGRIGYAKGANRVSELLILRDNLLANGEDVSDIEAEIFQLTGKTFKSVGGMSNIPTGNMRKNNAGVIERDYRDEGGFVPVGIKERADDVPAMLSKNEFVMTADAVRGIGNGSVEEGSKKLYNTMKKAEKVGKA